MTHLDKGKGRVLKRAFSRHEPTAQGPPGDMAQGGTQCSVGDTLQAWPGFGDLALGRPLLDFPDSSDEKESAHNVGDLCSVPGWGRSPGEGNGFPLQYSCLENSMNRGVQTTAHEVTQDRTQLSN